MSNELTSHPSESQIPQNDESRAFATPPVDVYESKEAFKLIAELPGVAPEDVHISLEQETLSLEAKRSDQPLDYRRRFNLSVPVDGEGVSARLESGILHLELPKAPSARPRVIPVATA